MNEFKKLLFIVNKYSGTGYQDNLEGRILNACEENDIECTIEFTKSRGHATTLAEEGIEKSYDGVIAVGGDGTVNEVARGLVNKSVPMGILPKGSGNGLARHIGISMNLQNAIDQVLTGQVITADTFKLNGMLSINVSGIGFDGHIANLFSKGAKRGFWGYTKLILKEYLTYKEFDFDLRSEEIITRKKNFIIAIANSSQYGNNAFIAPKASITDGMLEGAFLNKISFLNAIGFALKMFSKKLAPGKFYQKNKLSDCIIKTDLPIAFHVDGEPCGHSSEFKVQFQPASLKMIVPKESFNKV